MISDEEYQWLNEVLKQPMTELDDETIGKAYMMLAPRVGDLVKDAKDIEWLIQGMLPRGSVVLFGGEPKFGRKSLLTMYLSLIVGTTDTSVRFLGPDGKETQKGSVLNINLEDGYSRCARRYRDYGIRPGDENRIRVMTDPKGIHAAIDVLRRMGTPEWRAAGIETPALVVIDPFVEFGAEFGMSDENKADEVASAMRPLRELAQRSNATILVVHHFRKLGDTMRGSSALQGACDGWWEVFRRPGKPLRLRWVLRDGAEGEVDYNIDYQKDTGILIQLESEFRDEHSPIEPKESKKTSTESKTPARVDVLYESARVALQLATNPLSLNALAKALHARKTTVKLALTQLEEDGEIVEVPGQGWTMAPSRPR